MEKSPDAFRTISEVADLLDVPAHVLRFWESRFPQIRPVKRAGGRRYYRPADVALLSGIRRLLHEDGMTIRGVQKVLREKGVRHVSGLQEDPMEDAAEDLAPVEAPAPAPAPAEVIQLADRLAPAELPDNEAPVEAPVAEVMAEAAGHWPADPAEGDDPETAADAGMPRAWEADPDDPAAPEMDAPEDAPGAAPVFAPGPLVLEPAAALPEVAPVAETAPEPAPVPVLPDVPFDPAIADAPFHVASRLRAADPAAFAGRRAALAALHTRLSALRSALGPGAGKMRN